MSSFDDYEDIKRKGVIVCGFFGIGKSSVTKHRPDVSFYDLDAAHFKKEPGWEQMYVDCAMALRYDYDIVAIKSSDKVMNKLTEMDVPYYLVYPNKYAKRDFIERAIRNNYSRDWIQNFFSKWEQYIEEVEDDENAKKIVLQNGEYLSDIVDRLVRFR
jgi:hypothetical protein